MEFIATTCPHCGGALQIPTDRDTANCIYCNQSVDVKQVMTAAAQADTDAQLAAATATGAAGNWAEAYDDFTRVLERDPSSAGAWMGKGRAAAALSTTSEPRLAEMCIAFQRALQCAAADATTKAKLAAEIHKAAWQLFRAYGPQIDRPGPAEQDWEHYVALCDQTLDALDVAQSLSPTDQYLVDAAAACSDVLKSRAYSSASSNSQSYILDQTQRVAWERRLDGYIAALRKKHPNYSASWLWVTRTERQRIQQQQQQQLSEKKSRNAMVWVAGLSVAALFGLIITGAVIGSSQPSANASNPVSSEAPEPVTTAPPTVDPAIAASHEKRAAELDYWNKIAAKYAEAEVFFGAAANNADNNDLVAASGELKQAEDAAGQAEWAADDSVPDGWGDDVSLHASEGAHSLVSAMRKARKALDEDTNSNMSDAATDAAAATDSMNQAFAEAQQHFVSDGGEASAIQSPGDIIATLTKTLNSK